MKRMKIIDAHVHLVQTIAGTGAGGALRAIGGGRVMYDDGASFQMIPPEMGEDQVSPEAVLAVMNAHQVEKAVLLQGNFSGFQNIYSYEAARRYPDRFLAAASYDPFCLRCEGIRRHLFEELGIRVVKFEVSTGSGLMSNHGVLPLDGDVMEREYAYADDHSLVFVVDIGKLGSDSSQIPALRRASLRHSSMTFVVCHLLAPKRGMEWEMREGLRQLRLPNVWFDLASLPSNLRDTPPFEGARYFTHAAVEIVGADRLIFGTDMPFNLCSATYQSLVDCVREDPGLSLSQKQAILYDNACRVFFGG